MNLSCINDHVACAYVMRHPREFKQTHMDQTVNLAIEDAEKSVYYAKQYRKLLQNSVECGYFHEIVEWTRSNYEMPMVHDIVPLIVLFKRHMGEDALPRWLFKDCIAPTSRKALLEMPEALLSMIRTSEEKVQDLTYCSFKPKNRSKKRKLSDGSSSTDAS